MSHPTELAAQDSVPEAEGELLQGTWQVIRAVHSGEPVEGAETSYWIFTDNQVQMVVPRLGTNTRAICAVDPSTMPRSMQLGFASSHQIAAYEIDGDRLVMCIAPAEPGQAIPIRFESTEENRYLLIEFERELPEMR